MSIDYLNALLLGGGTIVFVVSFMLLCNDFARTRTGNRKSERSATAAAHTSIQFSGTALTTPAGIQATERNELPKSAFAGSIVHSSVTLAANKEPHRFHDENAALAYLRTVSSGADVVKCVFQTSDADISVDFLEGAIAVCHKEKLLHMVLQSDDNPYWHTWGELPWSNIVAVIRRQRVTPQVLTDVRQPDGTYARKGMYVQTRLYTLRRGIECRILSRDLDEMGDDKIFHWLRRHILDDEVRYFEDTQDSPRFGERPDKLDQASCRAESREQAWSRLG